MQHHDCQYKCHFKNGEYMGPNYCKVGYPRPLFNRATCEEGCTPWRDVDGGFEPGVHANDEPKAYHLDSKTDRYIYRTDEEEDRRLSTYVPLWLLAWGANMNVQYCTTAGFLSYIAKCAPPRPPPARPPQQLP